MDEHISRKDLIEEIEEEIEMGDRFDEKDMLINKGLKIALKYVKRQPSADVQPALSKEEYDSMCKRMAECANMGVEDGHIAADTILLEVLKKIGYKELVELFQNLDKWYA